MGVFAFKLTAILILIMIIGYYIVGVINTARKDDEDFPW